MKKWIAAVMLGVATLAFAQMDRYGNVMDEDGGLGSSGGLESPGEIALFFFVWAVCGVILFALIARFTKWSNMVNFHVAFFGGGLVAVFGLPSFL